MKILDSKWYAFLKMVAPIAMVALFGSACSEEKQEKLQDLAPVEIPKDIPGLYSGRMPCDDCTSRMIRMTLNDDSTVVVVQKKIMDSVVTDTLQGVYSYADSIVKVSLSNNSVQWNYKRSTMGNLSYMTSAGSVYKDEQGMNVDLIRIFKAPASKKDSTAKVDVPEEK